MEHKMQKSIIDDARKHHYLLSTEVVSYDAFKLLHCEGSVHLILTIEGV